MTKRAWFLERGGKYYGPFSTERVFELKESGKINEQTLICNNKEGAGATPFNQTAGFDGRPFPKIEQKAKPAVPKEESTKKPKPKAPKETPPSKAPEPSPAPEPKTTTQAPKPNKDEELRDEWYVLGEHGPYHKARLEEMLHSGQLLADVTVRQGHNGPEMSLLELLGPIDVEKKPSVRPMAPAKAKRINISGKQIVVALVTVAVCVLGFLFYPRKSADDSAKWQEKVQAQATQSNAIKKMLKKTKTQRPLPSFHKIVMEALTTGLNFSEANLRKNHKNDQDVYQGKAVAPVYGYLFPGKVAKEIRYIQNGNNEFNYLLGQNRKVFAVVVVNDSFKNLELGDYDASEFHQAAQSLDLGNKTEWQAKVADGVSAKAVWQERGGKRHLEYVVISNDLE